MNPTPPPSCRLFVHGDRGHFVSHGPYSDYPSFVFCLIHFLQLFLTRKKYSYFCPDPSPATMLRVLHPLGGRACASPESECEKEREREGGKTFQAANTTRVGGCVDKYSGRRKKKRKRKETQGQKKGKGKGKEEENRGQTQFRLKGKKRIIWERRKAAGEGTCAARRGGGKRGIESQAR